MRRPHAASSLIGATPTSFKWQNAPSFILPILLHQVHHHVGPLPHWWWPPPCLLFCYRWKKHLQTSFHEICHTSMVLLILPNSVTRPLLLPIPTSYVVESSILPILLSSVGTLPDPQWLHMVPSYEFNSSCAFTIPMTEASQVEANGH